VLRMMRTLVERGSRRLPGPDGFRPGRCWICDRPARTAEHRLKKSDLVRAYGRGPYKGEAGPVHVRDGKQTAIQGPGSRHLKYANSLCEHCNSTFSQPFDRAYEGFIAWIFANEERVLQRRMIDFAEVYGSEFEIAQRNLYFYLAKSFGCRLMDAKHGVPNDVVRALGRSRFRTALRISMSVHEDVLLMPVDARYGYIGKGNLGMMRSRRSDRIVRGYVWDENVSWLNIHYWYHVEPRSGLGSELIANYQCVYLGSQETLTPEGRQEARRLWAT
jgi:hypothetical protein